MCFSLVYVYRHKLKSSGVHFLYNFHIAKSVFIFLSYFVICFLSFQVSHIIFKLFLASTHCFVVKCFCSNGKVCSIVSKWYVNFIPGNSKCHHNICCRMSFREHIFNLFTWTNVPVRNIMLVHYFLFVYFLATLFVLVYLKAFTFSYMLHYLETYLWFNAFMHQIYHNVVTGTDSSWNCTSALFN